LRAGGGAVPSAVRGHRGELYTGAATRFPATPAGPWGARRAAV